MPPPAKRAILFDLDGVLWSSILAHRLAFEQTLREQGYPGTFSKHFYSHLAGMTTEKAFETLMAEKKIPPNANRVARFSKRKRYWALRHLRHKAKLHPRVHLTLSRLRRSYRLALVSSGHHDSVALFLRRSGTRRLFDVVLSSREVPDSKPSPRIYQTALRRLRLRPLQAVAVEDTVSGVRAAAGSGIPVIGIRGTTSPARLRKAGAFKIITRLSELT